VRERRCWGIRNDIVDLKVRLGGKGLRDVLDPDRGLSTDPKAQGVVHVDYRPEQEPVESAFLVAYLLLTRIALSISHV
jgi:hypothetical protein